MSRSPWRRSGCHPPMSSRYSPRTPTSCGTSPPTSTLPWTCNASDGARIARPRVVFTALCDHRRAWTASRSAWARVERLGGDDRATGTAVTRALPILAEDKRVVAIDRFVRDFPSWARSTGVLVGGSPSRSSPGSRRLDRWCHVPVARSLRWCVPPALVPRSTLTCCSMLATCWTPSAESVRDLGPRATSTLSVAGRWHAHGRRPLTPRDH